MDRYSYRRHDIKALAFLLCVVLVLGILFFVAPGDPDTGHIQAGPSGNDSVASSPSRPVVYDEEQASDMVYAAFDPNTADSVQLLKLGLFPYQVRAIYRYRSRGGVYRRPEDFARVPGLSVLQYRRLRPYVRISSDYMPASELAEVKRVLEADTVVRQVNAVRHKISPGEHVVLNTADTTELMTVPGIGSYYARRIYLYGQRLGGYVSVSQLDEIDELPDEAKAYFVVENPMPVRLPVNMLTLNQLKRHPYINFYQARDIVTYRRQHGPIKSLQDLELSPEFPPEAIRRLEPYVKY